MNHLEYENMQLREKLVSETLKVRFLTYVLEKTLNVPVSAILSVSDDGILSLSSKIEGYKIGTPGDTSKEIVMRYTTTDDGQVLENLAAIHGEDHPSEDVVMQDEEEANEKSMFEVNLQQNDDELLRNLLASLSKAGGLVSKICTDIRAVVDKKCNKLTMQEYAHFCRDAYTNFMASISQRSIPRKKIKEAVDAAFSAFSLRMVDRYDTGLTADDVTNIRAVLTNTTRTSNANYMPFSVDWTKLHNLCVSVLTIQECIERLLYTNKHMRYNLIFYKNAGTRTQKQLMADPFAFYRLLSVEEDGTRKWEMDNRLYNTTSELIQNVLPFCISYFRRVYFAIFNDNVYRVNFEQMSSVAQIDCCQVLKSIFLLLTPREIRKLFVGVVVKNATIDQPTPKDKLNMTSDDKVFALDLVQKEAVDVAAIEIVVQDLFDTISKVEMNNLIRTYK